MASTKMSVLKLYKSLLRECNRINSYNFRMYALEKVRYEFNANKAVTESEKLVALMKKGQDNLDIIKRQVLVGHMYGEGHLVIEHQGKDSPKT